MRLQGTVLPVAQLEENDITQMHQLMNAYYENVSRKIFLSDLSAKQDVLLFRDGPDIKGFSTQEVFEHDAGGSSVVVVFSGDTIISKDHWGTMELPFVWYKWLRTVEQQYPSRRIYWLLTSKGYMTYRFLPVFFQNFYPRDGVSTPAFEEKLLFDLATTKFPHRQFQSHNSILKASPNGQHLKTGIADIASCTTKDPNIQFFNRVNPGHVEGDELVCIANCNETNVRPFVLKRMKKHHTS